MKFYINNVNLWSKAENKRIIVDFQPNKVNVITGESNTGKTSLLKIVDYCLFAQCNDIPDDVNELNFAYGLVITINEKTIAIIRETNGVNGKVSENYIFVEDLKEFPENLTPEIFGNYSVKQSEIKNYLEKEFKITEHFPLLPKGNKIRKGSTLNLEYFFIYNSISQNIVINENDFFDYQLNDRDRELYKQALDSIFDLSIGLSSEDNYKIRQQKTEYENELNKLLSNKEKQTKKIKTQEDFVKKLIFKAKEFDLIDDEIDPNDIENCFFTLKQRIDIEYSEIKKSIVPSNFKELENKRYQLKQKLRTLIKFKKEVSEYTDLITEESETLLPLDYLTKNNFELISISEVSDFLANLRIELEDVRRTIKSTEPVNLNIDEEVLRLENEIKEIEIKLSKYPKNKQFISANDKSIFLIETRKDINHFLDNKNSIVKDEVNFDIEIKFYNEQIHELSNKLPKNENEVKRKRIELLNELIQHYINEIKDCLGNYKEYKADFDYNDKILQLRKPLEEKPSSIDGTSNYLFLQITLFLGLHELFIKQKEKNYIPQFLIIDYPSLPYKSGDKAEENAGQIENTDRIKLRKVFELLNMFISKMNNPLEYNTDFQIIILDHVQPDIWEDTPKLENFNLVDNFRNGKTLMKQDAKEKP